jgi:quercetin dioxygenase-like cupin family protein
VRGKVGIHLLGVAGRAERGAARPEPGRASVSMMHRRIAMTRPESGEFGVLFDLATIEQEMRSEEPYAREGHTARTLVREDELRVVLIAMKDGARVAAHTVDETVAIQTLTGRLRVPLPRLAGQREDRMVELPIGRLLVLPPGIEHGVEAVGDSALLLWFGWTPKAPAA